MFRFILLKLICVVCLYHCALLAPPTAIFWTEASTDIQPFGQMNFEVDNYFTAFNHPGKGMQLPIDVGLTVGIFEKGHWNGEVGFDYFGGTDYPVFFNAKVGIMEEDAYFKGMPTFNVGVFNIGTKPGITNQNVFDIIIGKKIPGTRLRLFAAGYWGSHALGRDRSGYMVGFDWNFFPAKDCDGTDYYKLVVLGDYASGKNAIGGGAIGFTYFFTPSITVTTGPVFFNDAPINGRWKWAIQFDFYVKLWENSRDKKKVQEELKKKTERLKEKK